MNPVDQIKKSIGMKVLSPEEEKEAKKEAIRKVALKWAAKDYNIVRIDGIDYITHFGIPVSMPDDSKNTSMCDRLEVCRENYINACIAANTILCHDER